MDKEQCKDRIAELVKRYNDEMCQGKLSLFSEADVGSKFILPLFEALGWDTKNIDEVKEQKRTLTGPADYALNIRKNPKIVVEIKKFTEDLDSTRVVRGREESYPYQATRYAWHLKVDWCVLSNFKEIRLYYAHTIKPEDGLIFKIRYEHYLDTSVFEQLWLLSKESVLSGRLERLEKRRTRSDIDEEILNDLFECRKLLMDSIDKNNLKLDREFVKESVQKILDRILVIRVAEDRSIIGGDSLRRELESWQKRGLPTPFMRSLKTLFRDFDDIYNSKLFEPHKCEDLTIDNPVLEHMLSSLYKYNFELITTDVLGAIYENYIGHILSETELGEVKIVKSRAERKRGGIYYTPTYIGDYIVRHTLGELLNKCKTPEDVSKIKVLDPACGSGSFLIKAFDVIKEWYDEWNTKTLSTRVNSLDNHFSTVTNIEKKILKENLFGVDIDAQATEITTVNLVLKALRKGERLPLISGENIKCGNSLIDDEKIAYEKAFNWEKEFKGIMSEKGFDVIIGNPPYVSNWQLSENNRSIVTFLDEKYSSITFGHWDIYILFIKKALELLKDNGFLSFIVPSSFAKEKYGKKLREIIIKNYTIISLAEFGTETVFKDVARQYIIFVIQKKRPNDRKTEIIHFKNLKFEKSHAISQKTFLNFNNFTFRTDLDDERLAILNKISSTKCFIGNICCVNVGVVAHSKKGSSISFKKKDVIHNEFKQNYKKYIEGRDISRYSYSWKGLYMDYEDKAKYFHRPKFPELFENNKIIVRRVSGKNNSIISVYDDTSFYTNDNLINIIPWNDDILKLQSPMKKWSIFKPHNYFSIKYILGILNSKLISYYFNKTIATGTLQGTYSGVYPEDVRMIPIKQIPEHQQQPIIKLVKRMLSLNSNLNEIIDDFARYWEPVFDQVKLRYFYNRLTVGNKEILTRLLKGSIKRVKVKEVENWLTFIADYSVTEKGEKKELNNVPIFRCKFDDDALRKFILHVVLNYKGRFGKGTFTSKILEIPIPCFYKDEMKNSEAIKKVMDGYLKAIYEKNKLEKEIREIDEKIDDEVFKLYDLTDDEITLVKKASGIY